jgi:hypothetical protein
MKIKWLFQLLVMLNIILLPICLFAEAREMNPKPSANSSTAKTLPIVHREAINVTDTYGRSELSDSTIHVTEKIFRYGGDWLSAIVLILTLSLISRQVKVGVSQVKATRRMRQQEIFVELMKHFNTMTHLSKNEFEKLRLERKREIKNEYHNFLDLVEQLIILECDTIKDLNLKIKYLEKRNKLYIKQKKFKRDDSAKDAKSNFQNKTPEIHVDEDYVIRLIKLYKTIQNYYIYSLEIEDFSNPFHRHDPHLDENRIVSSSLIKCFDPYLLISY